MKYSKLYRMQKLKPAKTITPVIRPVEKITNQAASKA
jgi:hypothetical protein